MEKSRPYFPVPRTSRGTKNVTMSAVKWSRLYKNLPRFFHALHLVRVDDI